MITQVVFNVDKKIKDKAMKRAKSIGVPFASYLKAATRAFADGNVGMDIVREKLNAKTRRELIAVHRDIEKGRNLSPAFSTAEDMERYLRRDKK